MPRCHVQLARHVKAAASGLALQRLAGAEQGADVDAVVDGTIGDGHGWCAPVGLMGWRRCVGRCPPVVRRGRPAASRARAARGRRRGTRRARAAPRRGGGRGVVGTARRTRSAPRGGRAARRGSSGRRGRTRGARPVTAGGRVGRRPRTARGRGWPTRGTRAPGRRRGPPRRRGRLASVVTRNVAWGTGCREADQLLDGGGRRARLEQPGDWSGWSSRATTPLPMRLVVVS